MTKRIPHTLGQLFLQRAKALAKQQAILIPTGDEFDAITWKQLLFDVQRTAGMLETLGIEPGSRVGIYARNCYQWIVVDLAVHCLRAVLVPAHAALSATQAAYQLRDSGAEVVFVGDRDLLAALEREAAALPELLVLIAMTDTATNQAQRIRYQDRNWQNHGVLDFDDSSNAVSTATAAQIIAERQAEASPDDLATILYTSGTTGEPKGVMLSQRNLLSNALASQAAFNSSSDEVRLNWLPLSHIFARTSDLYTWLVGGSQLALAPSPEQVVATCAAIQPTVMTGVPYFYEKVQRRLVEHGVADMPDVLPNLLGGRMRVCISGGAPLPQHVAEFYQSRGVNLLQGYGLTETSPVITTCTPSAYKLGSVGPALNGVELRIADDGEILTRGPHVMLGYWNNPAATVATIRDGWLYTGDLGQLDADGYLWITGRKKEIIVTAAGRNVSPAQLEALLTADPLIEQACVIGDGQKYLTALIVPNTAALQRAITEQSLAVAPQGNLLMQSAVHMLFQQRIDERLAPLAQYEQVRQFTLLERSFTVEQGELTPTLKLRRNVIREHFAAQIAAIQP